MGYIGKIANWYFSRKALPIWGILLIDNAIVFGSIAFMFLLYNRDERSFQNLELVFINALIYMVFYNIGFRIFRTYSGILRYSSFIDLQRTGFAMMVGWGLSMATHTLFRHFDVVDLQMITCRQIFASFLMATIIIWIERIAVKSLHDLLFANQRAKRTFIFGVLSDAIAIGKHIRSEKPMRFHLKGFATIDKKMDGHIMMGEKVYYVDENLIDILKKEKIEAIIVSPQRMNAFRQKQNFQEELINAGIRLYISQQEKEVKTPGDVMSSAPQLREISIEDLLPRDEIQVDMKSVGEQLTGKCIMITGSAGSIGSEMVRQIAIYKPSELVLVDAAETPQHDIRLMMQNQWPDIKAHTIVANICEKDYMESLFKRYKPHYVFHAAAYKHVPMMEDNPSEAVLNNIWGTKIIADMAVKYGVKKFVMVSTDKAVNPTNVMGCSKRICEIYVQSLDQAIKAKKIEGAKTQFVTTRFGNVLGSNGSVIPLFQEQIKNGGPVTVTHPDIVRFFMLIPEACKLVLEAGTKGNGGEIFVFDMGKPVRIADLANRMIRLSGAKNIEVKFTGLRPGEKLYEEVLSEMEGTKPTFHEKIRIADVRECDFDQVKADIESLIDISKQYDDMATVGKMKAIVPEYKSNNSVYEQLDAELAHERGGVQL